MALAQKPGGAVERLELPEHRMRKEVDAIPQEDLKDYRQILKNIGFKETDENILTLQRLSKLFPPHYPKLLFVGLLYPLKENGALKTIEDLKDFVKLGEYARALAPEQSPLFSAALPALESMSTKPKEELKKGVEELIRVGRKSAELGFDPDPIFEETIPAFLGAGLVKTMEDLKRYDDTMLGICGKLSSRIADPPCVLEPSLSAIIKRGLVKSTQDLEKYAGELSAIILSSPAHEPGVLDSPIHTTPSLVKAGLINSTEELNAYGKGLLRILNSFNEAEIFKADLFGETMPAFVDAGLVKSIQEMGSYGDSLLNIGKMFYHAGLPGAFLRFQLAIPSLTSAGLVKSAEDINIAAKDLINNPSIIDAIPGFPQEQLAPFKLERLSAHIIEAGSRKISELVGFPFDELPKSQREYVARLVSGLELIKKNEDARKLVKHGIDGTFQQYYDSLGENRKLLGIMKELGINSDVFVYHKGVEKTVFKKTVNGLESLEAGKQQIADRLQDVVQELFQNPKGEVFRRPAKVFADITQLDAREYTTGEDKAKAVNEMMLSNDEAWMKRTLSILERHLKSAGTKASSVVDSEELKGEVNNALFHVKEVRMMLGMPVKAAGGKSEIAISLELSDKNPITAMTNGNDSGCCVALNGGNQWTLPLYMNDMGTQIAEIYVTKEGKENRIGQAWLFAAKIGDESALLVDSINLTSSYKVMSEIYSATVDFVKSYAEKSGFQRVVMGTVFNDAHAYAEGNFEKREVSLEKIHTFEGKFYLDTFIRPDISGPLRTTSGTVDVFLIK